MPNIDRPNSAPVTRQTSVNSPQTKRASLPAHLKNVSSISPGELKEMAYIKRMIGEFEALKTNLSDVKPMDANAVYVRSSQQGVRFSANLGFFTCLGLHDGGFDEAKETLQAPSVRLSDENINPLKDVPAGPRQKVPITTVAAGLTSAIKALNRKYNSIQFAADSVATTGHKEVDLNNELARYGQDGAHVQWVQGAKRSTLQAYRQMWYANQEILQRAAKTNSGAGPDSDDGALKHVTISFNQEIHEAREVVDSSESNDASENEGKYQLKIPATAAAKKLNAILYQAMGSKQKELYRGTLMSSAGYRELLRLTENGPAEVTTQEFLVTSPSCTTARASLNATHHDGQPVLFKVIGDPPPVEPEGLEQNYLFPYGACFTVTRSQDMAFDFVLIHQKRSWGGKELLPS